MAVGSNLHVRTRSRGFTLLETLVVLAIVGLMMALVAPAIGRSMQTSASDVLHSLQSEMRVARSQAISRQHSVAFWLDLDERRYRAGTGSWQSVPEPFELQVRTAQREVRGQVAGIRFYPDGSSSGGRIGVQEQGETGWLEVDWLTGRISVTEHE